jgi:hypothetical protein
MLLKEYIPERQLKEGEIPFSEHTHAPHPLPANAAGGRDLRIDFIRGLVMFCLVTVHIETASWFNFLFTWERVGVMSGAEGFVILSGFVIAMVYKRKAEQIGWEKAGLKLMGRAFQLYRVNLGIIAFVYLLMLIPFINTASVTTFVDHAAGKVYPLFPAADANMLTRIGQGLMLRYGPHQVQILGLYVVLLLVSPLALKLLMKKKTLLLFGLSWSLYVLNRFYPVNLTHAQYENAFPTLTWQLLFFHGMAAGFHRDKLTQLMQSSFRKPVLYLAGVLTLGFLFFTLNHPYVVPPYLSLSVIPAQTFERLYAAYFSKRNLGLLRIVNYVAALTVCYYLLTRYWKVIDKSAGWFFVPLGRASLYVFAVHIGVIVLIDNLHVFGTGVWMATLGHTFALLLLWAMVKKQILFKVIPR